MTTPTNINRDSKKRGLLARLYHGETSFDFVGRKRIWFLLSLAVIGIGIVSLFTQGLNLGIDFRGGTAWDIPSRTLSVEDTRDAARDQGIGEAKIQVLGTGASRVVRVQHDIKCAESAQQEKCRGITAALAEVGKVDTEDVSINTVGPSWGKDVTQKAQRALVFFFIGVATYISFRFEWKMAVAALAAVVHDILVTVGVYSLFNFSVSPETVIAFLTILGFSIYDTIVVFDKVEENTKGLAASGRMTYADTVNLSMNQVLMRSLNTGLVAILPVLSVLIIGAYVMGATSLEDFGLALTVGLLTGAYSSIFIASPLLAMLKEREPRYASIRQRIVARGGAGAGTLTPAAAAAAGMGTLGGEPRDQVPASGKPTSSSSPRPSGPRPGGNRPAPRPRKKGRRR